MRVSVCLHICLRTMFVPGTCKGIISLELELQAVVTHRVGTGNGIRVLCKIISPALEECYFYIVISHKSYFKIHFGSFRESHCKHLLLVVFNLSSLFSGESTGLWLPLLSGMYLCLEFVAWQQSEKRGRNKVEPLGEVVECFKMGHRGTRTSVPYIFPDYLRLS